MSNDGAHLNIGAESAMKKIVGGEELPEPMTNEEFEQSIRTAPIEEGLGYDGGANACARIILETYEKYPELQHMTDSRTYLHGADGEIDWNNAIATNTTFTDVFNKLHPEGTPEHDLVIVELSGFMWGWAINAARKILGLGPLPNPALMTIRA